jgi:hypothetical protein
VTYNTTGTTSFNLDLNEVIEEAFERCGRELRTGYDFKTARRSLSLMLLEWANRGLNMWTISEGSIPLVAGTATYDLPTDTVDLMDHVIRTGTGINQTDLSINRISNSVYATIPNKNATGQPVQILVKRLSGANGVTGTPTYPQVTVWPTPDDSQPYTLVYWRLRRIQDQGTGISGQDIPFRFLPCLVAGLAYYLSMKLPDVDPSRMGALKVIYEEEWQRASEEDREKASVRFIPKMGD